MLKKVTIAIAGIRLVALVLGIQKINAAPVLDPVAVRAAAKAAGLDSLRNIPVPQVNNIGDFLNPGPGPRSMAVVLGKALFWDMQVGSDGQACASCYFSDGVDSRVKNQFNPGFTAGDNAFGNSTVVGVPGC